MTHASRDAIYSTDCVFKSTIQDNNSYHNTNISGEFCVGVNNSPESIVDRLCISIWLYLYKMKVYQRILTAYNIQF